MIDLEANKKFQGFSLIEAAIVLGVIGLVIGGIWAAAVAVRENQMASHMTAATTQVVENMRRLYGRSGAGVVIPAGNITDQMIKAGVIPASFTSADGFNCWNGGAVGAASPDDSDVLLCVRGFGTSRFDIELAGMNQSQCVKVVSKLQAVSNDMVSMELADTYDHTTSWSLLPIPPDLIDDECNWNSGYVRVEFESN